MATGAVPETCLEARPIPAELGYDRQYPADGSWYGDLLRGRINAAGPVPA